MSKQNRLHKIAEEIEGYMDALSQKTFTYADFARILPTIKESRDLPLGLTTSKFVDFLMTDSYLSKIELTSENYANLVRYGWKETSPYSTAASIKKNSFFSHGSAVDLHGVANETSNEIYVNYEQSPKQQSKGNLVQENVDRAFASPQRQSKLVYECGKKRIVVINGKFTNRLGIETLTNDSGNEYLVTSLERTLIDITVRPAYAGGVDSVMGIYKKLKGKISIDSLISTLEKLNYVYPYHQAIGFYMERAEYPKNQLSKLRQLGFAIDFYLSHGLGDNKEFDSSWRIFYPARP